MRAMVLEASKRPLRAAELPDPKPGPGQVLIRVRVCGVCRTDLHVIDGELPESKRPVIPGHQIVGTVAETGPGVTGWVLGERVGVPWLGSSCETCEDCRAGRENLCDRLQCTGYDRDGGFAERCVAEAQACLRLPEGYPDLQAAPLLCAGLIGYRAYRMTGAATRLGFYGFGAAAHILIQVARAQGRAVWAFTRPGDASAQAFARRLGAAWAGGSDAPSPEPLDAAIIFAPVGALVPTALRAVRKGGVVVCAGIQMSDIPSFPYALLWGERAVRSVANLTRRDAAEFLSLAPQIPVRTDVHPYRLEAVNEALDDLRAGRVNGAAVVVVDPDVFVSLF